MTLLGYIILAFMALVVIVAEVTIWRMEIRMNVLRKRLGHTEHLYRLELERNRFND